MPLSHPIVIDAATEFVPVAIYNNAKGADAEVLKRFGEPAWNNPVVRFVDAEGRDLIPRKDGVYATGPLVGRMVAALKAANGHCNAYTIDLFGKPTVQLVNGATRCPHL